MTTVNTTAEQHIDTETDDCKNEALRREQIRQRIAAKPFTAKQLNEREALLLARKLKKAEDTANAERDAPIRIQFHQWLEKEGFKNFDIPKIGYSYPSSHVQSMWEAFKAGALTKS